MIKIFPIRFFYRALLADIPLEEIVDERTPFTRFRVQRHVEKKMLFNIGLDIAYLFAGLYLQQIGQMPDVQYPALWLGFGYAVILQGAFLFCQDNMIHWLHYKNFHKARPFLEQTLEELIQQRHLDTS